MKAILTPLLLLGFSSMASAKDSLVVAAIEATGLVTAALE